MNKPPSSPALPPEPGPSSARLEPLEEQLRALTAERDTLKREIGVSDAAQIIAMVRSLEAQLVSLYEEREAGADHD